MTDLIVAGGGPAGLAAAIGAANAGLSVVVFEPRVYPIDKSCGEGLMPAAISELDRLGVERPAGRPFAGIRLISNDRTVEGHFRYGHGLCTHRTELSRVLRAKAEEVGVRFEAHRIRELRQEAACVEAESRRAGWMIAADGLHSTAARLAGIPRRTRRRTRTGVRAHFRSKPWAEYVEIHYSKRGEAYVAPVSESTVGVAILTSRVGRFDELIGDYPNLRSKLGPQVDRVKGAGPFPQWLDRRVDGRILFVGDAAGFLDPITGEGVQLGLRAARLAVDAIVAGDAASYDRNWWRMTRPYWWLTSLLLAVRNNPALDPLLIPVLRSVPGLFEGALQLLGGGGRPDDISEYQSFSYQTTSPGGSSGNPPHSTPST